MSDRIEKQIVIRAPRSRVWRAITDKTEFGAWFGVKMPAGTFAAEGTLLAVVESGFDRVPLHRRDEAFRMNESGWTQQVKNIDRHVTASR
jgi:hypothetical protein